MCAVVADGSSDWRDVVSALLKVEDYVEVVARVDDGDKLSKVSVLHPELLIMDMGIGSIDALTATCFYAISFHRWL